MIVSIIRWDVIVSSVNRFIFSIRRGIFEIRIFVNVCGDRVTTWGFFQVIFRVGSFGICYFFRVSCCYLNCYTGCWEWNVFGSGVLLVYFGDVWRDEVNICIYIDTYIGLFGVFFFFQNVFVIQLVFRMGEFVIVILIFRLVLLLVSVGVNYTWKEKIVIFVRKVFMV